MKTNKQNFIIKGEELIALYDIHRMLSALHGLFLHFTGGMLLSSVNSILILASASTIYLLLLLYILNFKNKSGIYMLYKSAYFCESSLKC